MHTVEVVGGSSRVPALLRIIKDFFGKEPGRTLNAKECVSRGAALNCAMLSPIFRSANGCLQLNPLSRWPCNIDEQRRTCTMLTASSDATTRLSKHGFHSRYSMNPMLAAQVHVHTADTLVLCFAECATLRSLIAFPLALSSLGKKMVHLTRRPSSRGQALFLAVKCSLSSGMPCCPSY